MLAAFLHSVQTQDLFTGSTSLRTPYTPSHLDCLHACRRRAVTCRHGSRVLHATWAEAGSHTDSMLRRLFACHCIVPVLMSDYLSQSPFIGKRVQEVENGVPILYPRYKSVSEILLVSPYDARRSVCISDRIPYIISNRTC